MRRSCAQGSLQTVLFVLNSLHAYTKKNQVSHRESGEKAPEEADFIKWKADFNLETKTADISQLLSTNPKLRAVHNELRALLCSLGCSLHAYLGLCGAVPKLTYSVFWERYYYRLQKLIKEEERRDKILIRANTRCPLITSLKGLPSLSGLFLLSPSCPTGAELESQLEDWGGWEDDDEAPEEVVTNGKWKFAPHLHSII